ncbi:MAG: nucleotidyltransferase domain-containing protein [Ignavibacteria bacterium]|nr:nucleotidyltransferase domain-containing protein [Ignavibacteria bacterium]
MLKDETINRIVKDIVEETNPEKIILFGSYANGTQNEDSDLDLLIVEKESFDKIRSRRKEINRIRKKLSEYRISKDILIYDLNEFNDWKNSINHIIGKSVREGKILYER